jgi:choloylglycine hydrolase
MDRCLKPSILTVAFAAIAAMGFFTSAAVACTDIRIKANDGSLLIARSMEFGEQLNSNLRTMPQGSEFKVKTPNGKQGLSWKSKYGYLYVDGFGQPLNLDGMNEKGLSFEALYMPGVTQYQSIPSGKENKALAYQYLGDWVLGNFATVEETKKALENILVFGDKVNGLGDVILPMHAAISDSSGKGIVVEFIDGKMNVYENSLGIMTNVPVYPWQITNLRNYVNLSPYNPEAIKAGSLVFNATGQGAGMFGIPGDYTPPSRFVKMAFSLKNSVPASDINNAINIAEHLMNNVDIPFGLVRAKGDDNTDVLENTQWVVFKDLSNKVLYYRTYEDLSLRSVSLDKLDISKSGTALKMPLARKPNIQDLSNDFLSTKGS